MKKILISLFCLSWQLCNSQTNLFVSPSSEENYGIKIIQLKHGLIIYGTEFEYLDLSISASTQKIIAPFSGFDRILPVNAFQINNEEIIIYWAVYNATEYSLLSYNYNLITRKFKFIDDIIVPNQATTIYTSSSTYKQDYSYTTVTSLFNSIFGVAIDLIRIDNKGNFELLKQFKKQNPEEAKMIGLLRFVNQILLSNDNKLILSGFLSKYLYTIDLNTYKTKIFSSNIWNPQINGWLFFGYPKMVMPNDSIIIATDQNTLEDPNFAEQLLYYLKIAKDTIWTEDFKVISNTENYQKDDSQISAISNNEFFTATNEYYEIMNYNPGFNSRFYITKHKDKNEIWHKTYGGDYFYRVFDIQYLDDCKVIITGSIADYFNNGLVQLFYMLLDCNGHIITSNVDINELNEPVILSPNPCNDLVEISIPKDAFVQNIELLNCNGNSLGYVPFSQNLIDVHSYPSGLYTLKINIGKKYFFQKLVIQH